LEQLETRSLHYQYKWDFVRKLIGHRMVISHNPESLTLIDARGDQRRWPYERSFCSNDDVHRK
jgi:hypothetical protein